LSADQKMAHGHNMGIIQVQHLLRRPANGRQGFYTRRVSVQTEVVVPGVRAGIEQADRFSGKRINPFDASSLMSIAMAARQRQVVWVIRPTERKRKDVFYVQNPVADVLRIAAILTASARALCDESPYLRGNSHFAVSNERA
jgi:hypothetical protein